jgi:hypothetical protein
MRSGAILLAAVAVLAGACLSQARTARDPAVCEAAFVGYDRAAWAYPDNALRDDDSQIIVGPALSRWIQQLRNNGCLTLSRDLDGMPQLAARLSPYTITDSGPAIPQTVVHLGVVLSIYDEGRVTQFFRGLGYRSRGVGAAALGRRLYIGPFTSQGALDQALETARAAGFISPIPTRRTRF